MFGKGSLLLVMGFSTIFLLFGHLFNGLTGESVDNETDYYAETVAHDCAVAGANMAANKVFLDPTWDTGFNDLAFNGGEIDASVSNLGSGSKEMIEIVSEGTYKDVTHTVTVKLQPSKFSKFAYYSESEGGTIWWTGSDTVWGPFHTQDYLRAYQHPVFMGKATTRRGLVYYGSKRSDAPVFNGSFESGVDLPLPNDGLTPVKNDALTDGWDIPESYTTTIDTTYDWYGNMKTKSVTVPDTAYITFKDDSIEFKLGYNKPDTTFLTADKAENGIIYVEGMDVRLKGTVEGQYSVASEGNIYLDDDIVYKSDPRTDPNSTDLLGIIAKDNVLISNNSANNDDINIDASIYTQDGGFGAEDYSTRPNSGTIYLLGGIIQHTRQAVGTFGSFGIVSGFAKNYRYDDRFMLVSPPSFPGTDSFEVVSWLEE
jgi:hypothetical protein